MGWGEGLEKGEREQSVSLQESASRQSKNQPVSPVNPQSDRADGRMGRKGNLESTMEWVTFRRKTAQPEELVTGQYLGRFSLI